MFTVLACACSVIAVAMTYFDVLNIASAFVILCAFIFIFVAVVTKELN